MTLSIRDSSRALTVGEVCAAKDGAVSAVLPSVPVCRALLRHPGNGVLAISCCVWPSEPWLTRGSKLLFRWLLFTSLEHMLTLILPPLLRDQMLTLRRTVMGPYCPPSEQSCSPPLGATFLVPSHF